jgi:hypothetical protein
MTPAFSPAAPETVRIAAMIPVAQSIYVLCVVTCFGCAFLLHRAWRQSRSGLLFWSALCFLILGFANLLLFADLVLYPERNLITLRSAVNLVAVVVLLYGLIFKSR